MKTFLSLVLALFVVSACSENPDAGRPANLGSNDTFDDGLLGDEFGNTSQEDVVSRELNELTPGTQSELVSSVGDRIFYGFNSARLSAEAMRTLERQAEWLHANPTVTVTIEGHCDERGTREYNLALGERRAIAVKEYLMSLGINAARIATISYGKEHPEYLGSNESAWSKNRRAVTVVN